MAIMKLEVAYLIVGAIAGAYLRYRIGSDQVSVYGIPVTILIVNVLGSFILGLTMTTIQKFGLNQDYVILLGIGFCGSLTTMSSFAFEASSLLEAGKIVAGFFDLVLNVGLSIAAVLAGRFLVSVVIGFL